jgi:hypothetical protein
VLRHFTLTHSDGEIVHYTQLNTGIHDNIELPTLSHLKAVLLRTSTSKSDNIQISIGCPHHLCRVASESKAEVTSSELLSSSVSVLKSLRASVSSPPGATDMLATTDVLAASMASPR